MPAIANPMFRSTLVAAAFAALALATLLAPVPVLAGQNVYAGGGQVRPAGPVAGDFIAAGGKLVVDQPVAGDALLAGGSVDLRAPVGEDLRTAGGDVNIDSTIGGELIAAGGNVTLTRAAAVGRGATVYGGSIAIDGRIDADLRATGRKIILDGEVKGDARLVADEIELGPKARIGGELHYVSRAEMKRSEAAFVGGAITRGDQERGSSRQRGDWHWERSVQVSSAWAWGVMSFLALLATAALFLLVAPRFAAAASQRVRSSPWLTLGLGLAVIVALPMVAVLLFITLFGIPLGFALLALYPALMLVGFVIGVLSIGRLVALALRRDVPVSYGGTMGYFALALLLTLLVASVPVVGGLVGVLLSLAGVGACLLELRERRGGPSGAPPASATFKTPAEAG